MFKILKLNQNEFQLLFDSRLVQNSVPSNHNTTMNENATDFEIEYKKTIKRNLDEFQALLLFVRYDFSHLLIYQDSLEDFVAYLNEAFKTDIPPEIMELIQSDKFQEFLQSEFGFEFRLKRKVVNSNLEIDEYYNLEFERSKKLVLLLQDLEVNLKKCDNIGSTLTNTLSINGFNAIKSTIDKVIKVQQYKAEALNCRQILLVDYNAKIQKTKHAVEKLNAMKSRSNIDNLKVDRLLADLQVLKVEELNSKGKFYTCSSVLKMNFKRIYAEVMESIENSLDKLVELNVL